MRELVEYRIERLLQRLTGDAIAELGVRVDLRGDTVLLSGTVSTVQCLELVRSIAETELAGIPLITDLVVGHCGPLDHSEVLP
ncbi:hypothetical protein [Streptomyces sp. NPDC089919]|uniref:hypothetical protein n=1 Tax=Streptomyces sp. NPDC089919 TaxID=3155188 RepID=UPI0034325298